MDLRSRHSRPLQDRAEPASGKVLGPDGADLFRRSTVADNPHLAGRFDFNPFPGDRFGEHDFVLAARLDRAA